MKKLLKLKEYKNKSAGAIKKKNWHIYLANKTQPSYEVYKAQRIRVGQNRMNLETKWR